MRQKLAKYYMANVQPDGWADTMVQRIIQFLPQSSQNNCVVQVDRLLSQVNHQLFRQSRLYEAKIDLEVGVDNGIKVDVFALVNTWWLRKAYKMAYDKFMENSAEERAAANGKLARWHDFRVYNGLPGTGPTAFAATDAAAWNDPTALMGKFDADQEYHYTELHDAAGVQYNLSFSGAPPGNYYNIIDEYDNAASTDDSPSQVQGQVPYDGLEDTIDDDAMAHITGDGNSPPYNKTNLENHVWVKIATLTTNSTGQQKLSTGYFTAPAGLIAIKSSVPLSTTEDALTLCVKPGNYKGVSAPSMLE